MTLQDDLQRRLEQATAADLPVDLPLDAESASLREGWLALEQLLRAAEPVGELPPMPCELSKPPITGARWTPARIAATLAASAAALLIGATLIWNTFLTSRANAPAAPSRLIASPGTGGVTKGIVQQPREAADQPRSEPQPAGARPAPRAVATSGATNMPQDEPNRLRWDDEVDDQLALLSQELVLIRQDAYRPEGGFESVRSGIEQIEEDFQDNRL